MMAMICLLMSDARRSGGPRSGVSSAIVSGRCRAGGVRHYLAAGVETLWRGAPSPAAYRAQPE
jgi:hypothetical protein